MSLFGKISTLAKGTAHDLLDKVIDMNSPSMLRQYLRDIEDEIGQMNTAAVMQEGQVRTLNREKSELDSRIAQERATIAKLLAATDPKAKGIAAGKASLVLQMTQQSEGKVSQIDSATKMASDMKIAVTKLQAKHDQMAARVQELDSIDRDSKAQEGAAHAIAAAGAALNVTNSTSIDNMKDRMMRRHDQAGAAFDNAMASLPEDEISNPEDVEALLAELAPAAK